MSTQGDEIDGLQALYALSKEELIELVGIMAKNAIAIDGTWFQSVERTAGMDEAMYHDVEAWRRFTTSEARRVKNFLGLGERSGLRGLEQALGYKITTLSNVYEMYYEDDALIFRIVDCRVQNARKRKGMEFHPCKPVGEVEYEGFAAEIDDRITSECVSCFPKITDGSCNCGWKFTLDESAS